jgi:hypothetical protein
LRGGVRGEFRCGGCDLGGGGRRFRGELLDGFNDGFISIGCCFLERFLLFRREG